MSMSLEVRWGSSPCLGFSESQILHIQRDSINVIWVSSLFWAFIFPRPEAQERWLCTG